MVPDNRVNTPIAHPVLILVMPFLLKWFLRLFKCGPVFERGPPVSNRFAKPKFVILKSKCVPVNAMDCHRLKLFWILVECICTPGTYLGYLGAWAEWEF